MTAIVNRAISEFSSSSKCLVFLDPQLMEKYDLAVDAVLRIRTYRGRSILGRIGEPISSDTGSGTIRLDRFMRQATRTRLNEPVELEIYDAPPVKKTTLIPAIDLFSAHNLVEHLSATFSENRTPVSPGAILYATFPDSVAGTTYVVDSVEDLPGIITPETEIHLEIPHTHLSEGAFDVTFEDVGGLHSQIRLVRELVQLPLQMPYVYRQLGINPPKGIIFYGPPGSGKTYLGRAIANEVQAQFYYINGPEIVGTLYGETESNLRKIFNEAAHHAPSIVMIDELDAIAPKRGMTGAHSDTRAVAQLLSLLDGMGKVEGVVVIGTTNRIDSIDTALRRPGRFDREIFFAPPDAKGRYEILEIYTREMPLADDAVEYLDELSELTRGFVGADIMELCREAGLEVLRRNKTVVHDSLSVLQYEDKILEVVRADFESALSNTSPSAMREILVTIPSTRWEDIGGLSQVKSKIRELIDIPLSRPDLFASSGIMPSKGILLHGPPGTGKTLLAKAVAHQCRVNFLAVDGPEVFTKWLGESEEAVRHIFKVARQVRPAIIFFDQLDAIAPRRGGEALSRTSERVVNQLLRELDGVESLSGIVVLAATNRLEIVDPSILRPGRFDTHIYISLPDQNDRKEILQLFLKDIPLESDPKQTDLIEFLVSNTKDFSGAELNAICTEAKMAALRRVRFESTAPIAFDDFKESLERIKKSRMTYAE